MGKILPILMVLIGLGGGGAAGFFLKPPPMVAEGECLPEDTECVPDEAHMAEELPADIDPDSETDFANLNKQFVIPIIKDEKVVALVVASLALEVWPDSYERVYEKEPKLRDEFLKVLFTHAHSGGFSGEFTSGHAMEDLRIRLYQVAREIVGSGLVDVLIVEIVRQDM